MHDAKLAPIDVLSRHGAITKRAIFLVFLLAGLSGCVVDDHHHHYPVCYDLAPGRLLTSGELHALEDALEYRQRVDLDNDLSFHNPIGPGRCYGEWYFGEWEIDCPRDSVVVNCSDA